MTFREYRIGSLRNSVRGSLVELAEYARLRAAHESSVATQVREIFAEAMRMRDGRVPATPTLEEYDHAYRDGRLRYGG